MAIELKKSKQLSARSALHIGLANHSDQKHSKKVAGSLLFDDKIKIASKPGKI